MKLKRILENLLKIFLLVICVCILIVLINIFLNQYLFVSKYQINSSKIPNSFDGYKIIQLTDIHSIRSVEQKEKILDVIKKQNPDFICITGDLIDAEYYNDENNKYIISGVELPDELTLQFVSELIDIADVYFVYGNHEMMLLDDPENNIFKTALEEMGVKILNNKVDETTIGEEKIKIVGVQDPSTLYKDKKYAHIGENHEDKVEAILNDLFTGIDVETNAEDFTILLSHRPEYFELYTKYPIDLALTGHTHGGVIRLPLIGGIYAHPQGWFPKYSAGIYENSKLKMIVGRGIGYSKAPIRIFNPPEIIEIVLNKI